MVRKGLMRSVGTGAVFFVLAAGGCAIGGAQSRIATPFDSARVQALPNHHPLWANLANDAGPLAAGEPAPALTLVLARSPEREQAFQQLLADQQNPASPDFHRWLSAAEIGERFGLSDADIGAITGWLEAQGLRVSWIAPGKTFIGFGGVAGDVNRAFHTELHNYRVNGKTLASVASDPMIPEALAPVIKGIGGLYTVEEQPLSRAVPAPVENPEVTFGGSYYIGPADFDTIYDVPPAYTGAGVTIGIVGRSRTDFTDFGNFRSITGSNFPNPKEVVPAAFGGIDPGPAYTSKQPSSATGDQGEATLDVIRSGSTAPGAQLLLVVATGASGGIDVDAQYLVQTNPVPAQVMNISFGSCESAAGSAGVSQWDALFQQAAAEGISVFVSAGDSGASGCDTSFAAPPGNPSPNSPNFLCSSSYVTCVGGTEFIDTSNPSAYWNSSNGGDLETARSYIPEGAWNEPVNSSGSPTVAATGGGVSQYIATPGWQRGVTGVPAANAGRYTPDVSFASASHDGYLGCFIAGGGDCQNYIEVFAGTSAAAPGMAGVAALLDQKNGDAEGNLNSGIYALMSVAPGVFHDVTAATSGVGACNINVPSVCNNSIPGPGSQSGGQAGYAVGVGYDEVTGLGSLDVASFIADYEPPAARTTPNLTVTPSASSVTAAQAFSVTVTVSGGSGKPAPSGAVTLTSGSYTSAATTLNSGSSTVYVAAGALGTGCDTLTASYAPDANSVSIYNSASGSATVTVTSSATTAPAFTLAGTAVTIAKGGSNTSTIAVTPSGGFTGSVTLTAAVAQSPSGALDPPTLSFGTTSPVSIASSNSQVATLTIGTTATTTGTVGYQIKPGTRIAASGGAALAGILLFLVPVRRRRWLGILAMLALLFVMAGAASACGGVHMLEGGDEAGGTSGTTPGQYTITISGTSGSVTATPVSITLTVQ